MLFNHDSGGSWLTGNTDYFGPIGRWDNITIDGTTLKADCILDTNDPKGKILNDKVENDFVRAASIGFRIIATSEDPEVMLKGQTRPTITQCELIEISLVDIPANKNALALYDNDGNKITLKDNDLQQLDMCLSASLPQKFPNNSNTMKLKIATTLTALVKRLKLTVADNATEVETELSPEQLGEINADIAKLGELQTQIETLNAEKATAATELKAANDKVAELTTKLSETRAIDSNEAIAKEEATRKALNEKKEGKSAYSEYDERLADRAAKAQRMAEGHLTAK